MRISIQQAQDLLNKGDVVALPTETVYGLGASIKHPAAIHTIFVLKGRPSNNPLIIHISDKSEIEKFGAVRDESFEKLVDAFWPGPLTIVLPVEKGLIAAEALAGLSTAAFRMPGHQDVLEVLKGTGPLVMPSANLSGRPSATEIKHVESDFGRDFPVVDGGACQKGLESTVVIMQGGKWVIIREGILSAEAFMDVLGYMPKIVGAAGGTKPICPGQLYRHYAPKAKLTLLKDFGGVKGVVLGFAGRQYPVGCVVWELGSVDAPDTIAEGLYRQLRRLDEEWIAEAFVDVDFPEEGVLKTVKERLIKAAAK